MAMIQCPECKNDVSDKANACVNCGFPFDHRGDVCIRLPSCRDFGSFIWRNAEIRDEDGALLWKGSFGPKGGDAVFEVDGETKIVIDYLTLAGKPTHGIVKPNNRYEHKYVKPKGFVQMRTTYELVEI